MTRRRTRTPLVTTLPVAGKKTRAQFQSLEASRVDRIDIYRFDIPLRGDFTISGSAAGVANNVLISILTRDGLVGWGEASPVSRVTNETQSTCIAEAKKLRAAIGNLYTSDITGCVDRMDRTLRDNTTIKSAFDIALHDLAAQRVGLPLWKYLGGRYVRSLPTDATIFIRPLEQVAARVRQLKAAGFRIFKIKLGGKDRDDLERVRLIREIVGPGVDLRVDANEGWTPAFARKVLPGLKSLGVLFCEQPLPAGRRTATRELAKTSPLPLMADESLFSPDDATWLAREKIFSCFNIKLSKSGGLHHARTIARIARDANIPCMIGCMNESRLGLSASAHFAASNASVKFFDLDSFLMQRRDFVDGGIRIERGCAILPNGPGLGARPTAAWLKKNKPVT